MNKLPDTPNNTSQNPETLYELEMVNIQNEIDSIVKEARTKNSTHPGAVFDYESFLKFKNAIDKCQYFLGVNDKASSKMNNDLLEKIKQTKARIAIANEYLKTLEDTLQLQDELKGKRYEIIKPHIENYLGLYNLCLELHPEWNELNS